MSVSALTRAFFDQFQLVRLITIVILSPEMWNLSYYTPFRQCPFWLVVNCDRTGHHIKAMIWYEKNFRAHLQFSLVEICYSKGPVQTGPVPYSSLLGFKPSKQQKKWWSGVWWFPINFYIGCAGKKKNYKKNWCKTQACQIASLLINYLPNNRPTHIHVLPPQPP